MDYKRYFKEICRIPHGSGNLKGIQEYLAKFANEHHLECYVDEFDNVVIRRLGGKKSSRRPPVVLQAHMDMVAVAIDDRDMSTERIAVFEEDGFFVPDGTSLGADNAIGCAYILALLASEDESLGEIVGLFTADEETTMRGARGVDLKRLKSRLLINLDSEEEGVAIISSAGGVHIDLDIDISQSKEELSGTVVEVALSGLQGGHSGTDIDKSRSSATKILIDFTFSMLSRFNLKLINVKSGDVSNAIAQSGNIKFLLPEGADFEMFREAFMAQIDKVIERNKSNEPDISIKPRFIRGRFSMSGEVEEYLKRECYNFDNKVLFQLLSSFPQGIIEKKSGAVNVSNNIGCCNLDFHKGILKVSMLLRSNESERLSQFKNKMLSDIKNCNINKVSIKSSVVNEYSPWQYKGDSHLLDVAKSEYKKLSGAELKVSSIHAGLECGIFAARDADLDIISIGPDISDVHTVNEYADIDSCDRTFEYLKAIMANV